MSQSSYVVCMSSRISLWGRAIAQHPPVRRKPTPKPRQFESPELEVPPEPVPSRKAEATSVYHTPDAWPRKFGEVKPFVDDKKDNPVGRPRMRTDQRRRNTISIALSEEEEKFVRAAAAEKGISISEWARVAFFRSMGKKVPPRDMARRVEASGPEKKS